MTWCDARIEPITSLLKLHPVIDSIGIPESTTAVIVMPGGNPRNFEPAAAAAAAVSEVAGAEDTIISSTTSSSSMSSVSMSESSESSLSSTSSNSSQEPEAIMKSKQDDQ